MEHLFPKNLLEAEKTEYPPWTLGNLFPKDNDGDTKKRCKANFNLFCEEDFVFNIILNYFTYLLPLLDAC